MEWKEGEKSGISSFNVTYQESISHIYLPSSTYIRHLHSKDEFNIHA